MLTPSRHQELAHIIDREIDIGLRGGAEQNSKTIPPFDPLAFNLTYQYPCLPQHLMQPNERDYLQAIQLIPCTLTMSEIPR
jgi:hypothetical protein